MASRCRCVPAACMTGAPPVITWTGRASPNATNTRSGTSPSSSLELIRPFPGAFARSAPPNLPARRTRRPRGSPPSPHPLPPAASLPCRQLLFRLRGCGREGRVRRQPLLRDRAGACPRAAKDAPAPAAVKVNSRNTNHLITPDGIRPRGIYPS